MQIINEDMRVFCMVGRKAMTIIGAVQETKVMSGFLTNPQHNDLHPTMTHVELCERAILNSSKTKDIVLDPFGFNYDCL